MAKGAIKSAVRFKRLWAEADDTQKRGERRLAADKYLEAFNAAPSKWSEGRVCCLREWFHSAFPPDKPGDVRAACPRDGEEKIPRRISEDASEPLHVRFVAMLQRSLIQRRRRNSQKEVSYLRRALALAGQLEGGEREMEIVCLDHEGDYCCDKIGEWVDRVVEQVEDRISRWETPTAPAQLPECFSQLFGVTIDATEAQKITDSVLHRASVGGSRCDCCQKSKEELGLASLLKCSRCRQGYYCSVSCQATQWNNGHREHCKTVGEITVDDRMVLQGLGSRPELNGIMVKILRPDARKEGRWEVLSLKGEFSIATKNLRHMRPLK